VAVTVSVKILALVELVALAVLAIERLYEFAVEVSIETPVLPPLITKVLFPVPPDDVDPVRVLATPCVVVIIVVDVEIVGKALTVTVKVSRVEAPTKSVAVITKL
jgi:hypothetical protein